MRWWTLTAGAAFVVGVAAMVLLLSRKESPATAPGSPCPALALPSFVPATAGLSVTGERGVKVMVDGVEAAGELRVTAGRRRVEASKPGRAPLALELEFQPFSPATLDVRVDGPALVGRVLGARCAGCDAAAVDVHVDHEPGEYSLDRSALALSRGDWRAAMAQLRHVPPVERAAARFDRQLAAALALAGQPTRHGTLRLLVWALDARRSREVVPERLWQVARWNDVTGRFTALAGRFAADADPMVRMAGARMDAVSAAFLGAHDRGDVAEGGALLRAGEETLDQLALGLEALHPRDCAWVERLNEVLSGEP